MDAEKLFLKKVDYVLTVGKRSLFFQRTPAQFAPIILILPMRLICIVKTVLIGNLTL